MSSGSNKTVVLNFNFDGSMDQRSHARQAQSPQVLSATNVRYPELGSVEKRPGMAAVAGAFFDAGALSNLINGKGRLMKCGDELLVTDGYYIGTHFTHPTAGQTFVKKGRVPEALSRYREVDSSQYEVSQPDVAVTASGLEFHVWCSDDRTPSPANDPPVFHVYWTVRDQNRGGEVLSVGQVTTSDPWQPHVVAVGDRVALFYTLSGTGTIVIRLWDTATLTWGAGVNLVTDGATLEWGTQYRVCTDGTDIFLVYNRVATIRVLRISATTGAILSSIVSTETFAANTAPYGFGICANPGERVWVTYGRVPIPMGLGGPCDIRASAYSLTLGAETTAPFTVDTTGSPHDVVTTSVCRVSSTTACVLASVIDFSGGNDGRLNYSQAPVISSTGVVVGSSVTSKAFWCIPASSPFVGSTNPLRVYAWCHVGGAALGNVSTGTLPPRPPNQAMQWTMMLVDLRADTPSSTNVIWRPVTWQTPRFSMPAMPWAVRTAASGQSKYSPSSAVQDPSGKWRADGAIRKNNISRVTLATYEADFNSPDMFTCATLGRTLLMVPGWYWDRRQMAEISFAHWPQQLTATPSATGGNLKNGETYAYRAIYEYVDGTGAVHRSKPSDPITVVIPAGAGAAGSVAIDIPTLSITARMGDVATTFPPATIRLVVYRAGPASSDDLAFYRLQADKDLRANSTLFGTLQITDIYADFDTPGLSPLLYKQRDTLYTAGGVLDNVMPPGFTSIVTYHDRSWISYGNATTFSKFFVSGEAVNFTDGFEIPFEEVDRLTALAVMDDTIYFSASDRIYANQCDGPTDANTLSDIARASRVATDKGIIDQRSIVVMPQGMMYQASVGIQLMSRGRAVNPEPIGSRIQDELALYPEITSATTHPTGGYVTFCARNPTPSSGQYDGIRLVYDYTTDRWSRDTLLRGLSTVGHGPLSELEHRGTVYTYFAGGSANVVYSEQPGSWLDGPTWVPLQIVLSEMHPAGLQGDHGFKKWSLNAQRYTDFDISMSWFRDYETSPFDSHTIASNLVSAAPVSLPFSEVPTIHKASSMRLVLQDATPTGGGAVSTGRGGAFVSIALEVDQITDKIYRNAAQEKS